MKITFSNIFVVLLYVLGCFSLGWHLAHGFQSAFRTFGLLHHKNMKLIYAIGLAYSIIIPFLFALMPIFLYLNIEIDLKAITLLF